MVGRVIQVMLNDASELALRVLSRDGRTVDEVIRAALVQAAEATPPILARAGSSRPVEPSELADADEPPIQGLS